MRCEECKIEFNAIQQLRSHIKLHDLSSQEYYIKYISSDRKCKYFSCTNLTTFQNIEKGFRQYCSKICSIRAKGKPEKRFNTKIGRLLVTDTISYNSGYLEYLVKCDCGTEKFVSSNSLRIIRSCGCLKDDVMKEKSSKNIDKTGLNQVFGAYKNRAKNKNIEFSIEKDSFLKLIKQNCHYCNALPENIIKSRTRDNVEFFYSGLDRLNNEHGYTIDNSVPCCKTCNFLKRTLSYNQFIEKVFAIANNIVSKNECKQLGILVEQLSIANTKLYNLCSLKDEAAKDPGKFSKEELVQMAQKDIELCRERAKLKSEINRLFNGKIAIEEIKDYGK